MVIASTVRPSLFATVPSRDYLLFWQSGRFQPQRVARFLDLTRDDVARISGVAAASVRFDRKAPRDLLERLTEVAAICTLVAEFFAGDVTKCALWFRTPNPLLGEISPRDMIRLGENEKLRSLVMGAISAQSRAAADAEPRE
jgi:hypothetical protein